MLNRHPDGLEKCIGCELCAWACPADAIYVEGADNTEEERFSPGERYGRVYQINYLRCIFCGLCIEACPTRALTMTNEYELADDNRAEPDLQKEELLAPLLPGMAPPPHPMVDGHDEQDYYHGRGRPGHARAGASTPPTPSRAAHRRPTGRAEDDVTARRTLLAARRTDDRHRRGGHLLDPRADRRARRARHDASPRRPCTPRCCSPLMMLCLGVLYLAQDAPFLGVVQIVVYTGAVMMLFLFVLMLVGVDSSDSLVETLRGQRWAALLLAPRLRRRCCSSRIGRATFAPTTGLAERQRSDGNVAGRRRADLQQVRLRLRGHQRPADHRGARRDGAGPPRAASAPSRPSASWSERARSATAATRRRCPAPASTPGTTRSTPRRCCPTARPAELSVSRVLTAREQNVAPGAAHVESEHDIEHEIEEGRRRDEPRSTTSTSSALLFAIGGAGVLMRRNAIVVFMCVELMLNATNLAFVTFARMHGNLDGQVIAFFVMVVAAAEVVVGLAIIMTIFRTRRSASVDDANLLKY